MPPHLQHPFPGRHFPYVDLDIHFPQEHFRIAKAKVDNKGYLGLCNAGVEGFSGKKRDPREIVAARYPASRSRRKGKVRYSGINPFFFPETFSRIETPV